MKKELYSVPDANRTVRVSFTLNVPASQIPSILASAKELYDREEAVLVEAGVEKIVSAEEKQRIWEENFRSDVPEALAALLNPTVSQALEPLGIGVVYHGGSYGDVRRMIEEELTRLDLDDLAEAIDHCFLTFNGASLFIAAPLDLRDAVEDDRLLPVVHALYGDHVKIEVGEWRQLTREERKRFFLDGS